MNQSVLDEVAKAVREVTRCAPSVAIGPETTATDVPGWDSLAHVTILAKVEKRFGVRLSLAEIRGLKTVDDLVRVVTLKSRNGI